MLLGLGIAILLSRETRFTKILRVVLIFPLMIAPVIATLIWQLMTNNYRRHHREVSQLV
jgi:multiple sugar transport system permease protein